jgi:hypothetical protein
VLLLLPHDFSQNYNEHYHRWQEEIEGAREGNYIIPLEEARFWVWVFLNGDVDGEVVVEPLPGTLVVKNGVVDLQLQGNDLTINWCGSLWLGEQRRGRNQSIIKKQLVSIIPACLPTLQLLVRYVQTSKPI